VSFALTKRILEQRAARYRDESVLAENDGR